MWAGIDIGGKTQLVSVDGNMNNCENNLETVVFPCAEKRSQNFVFMHDNGCPH